MEKGGGVKSAIIIGACVACLPEAAIARGFTEPAGPIASAQFTHFGVIGSLMLLVVVPMFVALPIVLLRYRRGGRGTYRPDWDFNWGLEALIWGIPVALLVFLATALWRHTLEFDPYRPLGPSPLEVQVVALDWKFLFLYPAEGVATLDLLALPEDRPVTLKLTSGTVMQSFVVPRLAGQIYAMAGMQTQLNLAADETGDFIGRNTQYNGLGFATQSFTTRVMSPADFDAWVADAKSHSAPLDADGYATLVQPAVAGRPVVYGGFPPGLFDEVIGSFAPGMVAGQRSGHRGHAPLPEAPR